MPNLKILIKIIIMIMTSGFLLSMEILWFNFEHFCIFVAARDAQINVILVVENELYIGTSSGHLMICESMSLTPILSLRCFSEQIDYLIPLQMTLNNRGSSGRQKEKLVLCSGRGCLDKWNKGKRKRPADKKNCTILTWFADQWAT